VSARAVACGPKGKVWHRIGFLEITGLIWEGKRFIERWMLRSGCEMNLTDEQKRTLVEALDKIARGKTRAIFSKMRSNADPAAGTFAATRL
jgi:hypothetical protein